MLYIVKVFRDIYETNEVEVVGIFDTEEKAYKAKAKVVEWMEEEYEDFEVFVSTITVNHLDWDEFEEDI